jgi:protein SCO1/2
MKKYFLIVTLVSLYLFSCKNSTTVDATESSEVNNNQSISDLSIYNLPSKWTNQDNEEIELIDYRGNIVVMVMIYTSCKASCPRLVSDMRDIESQVPKNLSNNVKYILVSIDPETDTPERLKEFSIENKMDGDQWVFLRGSLGDTREFAAVLAVNYKEISPLDFSHSNIITVFNQEGELYHQKEGLGIDSNETIEKIKELDQK